jgi:hypothetical protein
VSSAPLSQKYINLFAWAEQFRVRRTLIHLVLASGADDETHVDVCVGFLTKPTVRDVLREWADTDSDCAELLNLSEALLRAPAQIAKMSGPDPAIRRREYYQSRVTELPVILCLGVRRPSGDEEFQRWFDQVRVWVALQGYARAKRKQLRDRFVAAIADRLRLAGDAHETDKSHEWLEGFSTPRPSAAGVTRQLLVAARSMLKTPNLRSVQEVFCRALDHVASGHYERSDNRDKPNGMVLQNDLVASMSALQAQEPAEPVAPTHSDAVQEFRAPKQMDAQALVELSAIAISPEEGASHTQALLAGRGLQIRTVESLQFLRWSWDTPTDCEQEALNSIIALWASSASRELALLALVCRVALLTSRSVRLAQALTISDESKDDWSITPDLTTLHRLRPRRSSGRRITEAQQTWVRPLLESMRFQLRPEGVALQAPHGNLRNLDQLWRKIRPQESAESMFNRLCLQDPLLQRISSKRLAGVFAKSIYHHSSDAVLAQMLSKSANDAFGGNSAYASWPVERILAPVQETALSTLHADRQLNAAGSEFDPLDAKLRAAIASATQHLREVALEPAQWLAHHNAAVTYVVAALLAATGARPVTDPFESPTLIDWDQRRIFLSEKASREHSGRLVPLPQGALKLLLSYLAHLQHLAELLAGAADALSDEIRLLANRSQSKRLPLFFFLEPTGGLHWVSVSEETLASRRLFDWPLPWNVMRHRLSARLRGCGADTELVDALLGHADQGVLTHGSESPRTWAVDMHSIEPSLERAYAQLGFCEALPREPEPPVSVLAVEERELASSRLFGRAAREARRRDAHRAQTRHALETISKALGGRTAGDLSPDDWDHLATELLTIDGHRKHPNYRLRYQILQQVQLKAARNQTLNLGRVYVVDREVASPYRECAVGCESLLLRLQEWFESGPNHYKPSRLGARQALTLSALHLTLVSRVTWPELLRDVLRASNYRVVSHEGRAFVEYHPLLHSRPDAPVVRHRISWRCAAWLHAGEQREYSIDSAILEVPDAWSDALDLLSPRFPRPRTVGEVIRQIASVVEQANYIQRPGLIAGYAAGQTPASALPHNAWILHTAQHCPATIQVSQPADSSGLTTFPKTVRSLLASPPHCVVNGTGALAEATRLFADIREMLLSYEQNKRKKKQRNHKRREHLTTRIVSRITDRSALISSAVWCLAAWAAVLTVRGPTKERPYAISTVRRYLSALSSRFAHVGSGFELLRADADGIAAFYSDLLEVNRERDLTYVIGRLQAFHSFMRDRFGLAEIDWGELDCGSPVAHGSPGQIGLQQYQNALELIAPEPATTENEQLAAAFLLLLSFRFGLRGADALGLQARDWREVSSRTAGSKIVVQVRRNELRGLKRDNSGRRLVPQIENFAPIEAEIIEHFLRPFAAKRASDASFPLFANDVDAKLFDLDRLADIIDRALQLSHRERVTLHKGRHAYASRLAQALMGDHLRPPGGTCEPDLHHREVRQLLLGTDRVTRRAPWALSRCLGHARPFVTLKSYVHFLPLWCDEWNCAALDAADMLLPAFDLGDKAYIGKDYVRWEPMPPVVAKSSTFTGVTQIQKFLKLRRSGVDARAAARLAQVSAKFAARAEKHIESVTRMLDQRTRHGKGLKPLHQHLKTPQWELFSVICAGVDQQTSPGTRRLPKTIELGLQLLSPNRQLVAWEYKHFLWLADFVRTFSLRAPQLVLLHPTRLAAKTRSWIAPLGLSSLAEGGERPLWRIDAAAARPRGSVWDRCALAIRPRYAWISTDPQFKPKRKSRNATAVTRARQSAEPGAKSRAERSQTTRRRRVAVIPAVSASPTPDIARSSSASAKTPAMMADVLALLWVTYLLAFCPVHEE